MHLTRDANGIIYPIMIQQQFIWEVPIYKERDLSTNIGWKEDSLDRAPIYKDLLCVRIKKQLQSP